MLLVVLVSATSTVKQITGNVYTATNNSLVGVFVEAYINGTPRGNSTSQNITAGYESYYIIDVQGDTIESGANITFRIDGVQAVEYTFFENFSNTTSNFDLHLPSSSSNYQLALFPGWNLISIPITL